MENSEGAGNILFIMHIISIDYLNVHTCILTTMFIISSEVQIQQEKRNILNIVNVGSEELFEITEEKIDTLPK